MGILFNQNWPKSSRAWFLCHFNESPASNTRCESCKYSVKCWSMLKPGPATDTSARFSTGVVQTHDKNSSRLQQARMFFLHIQVYWQFASFWAAFSVNVFVHNRLSVRIYLNNSNLARPCTKLHLSSWWSSQPRPADAETGNHWRGPCPERGKSSRPHCKSPWLV